MSRTGNTKKVAEAIFGEIKCEKEIKNIKEINDLSDYDFSFVGFPVHREGPDSETEKFLQEKCKGKKIAMFITHASPENHAGLPASIEKFKQAAKEANLTGTFNCQGQLDKKIKFLMSLHPRSRIRVWAKNDNSYGQPDEISLEKARSFARETINKINA